VALTCLNFFILRKLISKWTADAAAGRSGNAPLLMLPKMIGLMGAVAVAVLFLPISVVAFTVGYSIFLISIIVDTTYSALREPAVVATEAPGATEPPGGPAPGRPTEPSENNHG
jgi:hypothetical protein